MNIYPIIATEQYKGCGRAWAAVNANNEVVALRYMNGCTDRSVTYHVPGWGKLAKASASAFSAYREQCLAELSAMGTVIGGQASCMEFVA